MIKITGYCPMGCGQTLFLGEGGYVTCSMLSCPNPTSVSDLLDDLQTEHVMTVTREGFTLRHPLRERIGRKLEECEMLDLIHQTPIGQWEATTGISWTDIIPGATFTVDADLRMWRLDGPPVV